MSLCKHNIPTFVNINTSQKGSFKSIKFPFELCMARTRDDTSRKKKSKEKHEDLKLAVPTKLFLICPLCVGRFGKKIQIVQNASFRYSSTSNKNSFRRFLAPEKHPEIWWDVRTWELNWPIAEIIMLRDLDTSCNNKWHLCTLVECIYN